MERERSLYVDLIESDGLLQWWAPHDSGLPSTVGRPIRLVQAIVATGLVSTAGLAALSRAWDDFDPQTNSHCQEWADRTRSALNELDAQGAMTADDDTAYFVCDRWPMPMVELDVEEDRVEIPVLEAQRDAQYEAFIRSEYGFDQ